MKAFVACLFLVAEWLNGGFSVRRSRRLPVRRAQILWRRRDLRKEIPIPYPYIIRPHLGNIATSLVFSLDARTIVPYIPNR